MPAEQITGVGASRQRKRTANQMEHACLDGRYSRRGILFGQQLGCREKTGNQRAFPGNVEIPGNPEERQNKNNLSVVVKNRCADAVDTWNRHAFSSRDSSLSNIRQNGVKLRDGQTLAIRSLRPEIRTDELVERGTLLVCSKHTASRRMRERHNRADVNTCMQRGGRLNALQNGWTTVSPRGEKHTLLDARRKVGGRLHCITDCGHHAKRMQPHAERQRPWLETRGDGVPFDEAGTKQAHHIGEHLIRGNAAARAELRKCHWFASVREILKEAATHFHALNAALLLPGT